MAGTCPSGKCVCDAGWAGDSCEFLNMGRSWRCGEAALCLPDDGSEMDAIATWGGNVVKDDDGSYHMFAAMMSHDCPLKDWLTNSVVVHATSSNMAGPFAPQDVALGPTASAGWDDLAQHNPTVARAPDGTYLLFYMGTTAANTTHVDCSNSTAGGGQPVPLVECVQGSAQNPPVCNQRVGLATSQSPTGPWARRAEPILLPGPAGEWDDLFTTNPTVHVFTNGSVLLVYKARSFASQGAMLTGTAFAEHWSGPYVRSSPSKPINTSLACEDASVYYSEAMHVFRLLLHCNCNYQSLWSLDGVHWNQTTSQVPWCNLTYTDGTTEQVQRRERPQWILDDSGKPVYLMNG
eukprot:gene15080-23028_t